MVVPSEMQLMIILLLLLMPTPRIVHTADALRLLVVERFGGFYSDTDVVFLRFWNGDSSLIRRTVVMMLWHDNDCDSVLKVLLFVLAVPTLLSLRSVANLRNVIASDQEVCCYNYIINTLLNKIISRWKKDGTLMVN